MNTILEAKKINKKVELEKNNELHILKDVDLTIEKGEFIAVMGPSGSGKTTLLYNISGMDAVSSGEVVFHQDKLNEMKEEKLASVRLDKMGFIFQDINLLKNLSLIDNIVFPAFVAKNKKKEELYEKANQLMKMTGIDQLANNSITQASGGQLQRVAICRALMNDPDIIFGDEPTGALDSKATSEIMSILEEIHQNQTTILLVTHDAKVAAHSERVLFMMDGKIIAEKKFDSEEKTSEALKNREEGITRWLIENGL